MKRLLFLLAGLTLVLAACTQAPADTTTTPETPDEPQETYRCPDGTVVTEMAECPEEPLVDNDTDEAAPADTDEEPADESSDVFKGDQEATAGVPAKLESMRERAADKTSNGYAFTYEKIVDGLPADTALAQARIHARGELRAIAFPDTVEVSGNEVSYLVADLAEGTAQAWCADECAPRGGPFNASTELAMLDTPKDVLYGLEDASFEGSETVNSRSALKMAGTYEGESVTVYIDEFSGIPVKLVSGEEATNYKRLSLGTSSSAFDGP